MQEIYKQLSLSIGAQIREVMDYPILIKYVTIDTGNHDKKWKQYWSLPGAPGTGKIGGLANGPPGCGCWG